MGKWRETINVKDKMDFDAIVLKIHIWTISEHWRSIWQPPSRLVHSSKAWHYSTPPNLNIAAMVCFTYPHGITMEVDEDQLHHLFTILQQLHRLAGELVRAIMESENGLIPPLGFMWLVCAWQVAWDKATHTGIFSIEASYFNWSHY